MQASRATKFTIGGFRVGFDWSVLIVLGLVTWSLASQVLPSGFPGHSTQAYWIAALAAAGLFLGSLVMHELSHAIAARRVAGVEVTDITFWLFGGVARIRGELPSPRLQLLVAGIGPLTSLTHGAVARRHERDAGAVQPDPRLASGRRPHPARHPVAPARRPPARGADRRPGRAGGRRAADRARRQPRRRRDARPAAGRAGLVHRRCVRAAVRLRAPGRRLPGAGVR